MGVGVACSVRVAQEVSPEEASVPQVVWETGGPPPHPALTPAAPILTSAPFSQDPHVDQYEAKEWTFIIENVSGRAGQGLGSWGLMGRHLMLLPRALLPGPQESKGQRKVLATVDVDLAHHAGPVPVPVPLRLRLKPKSVKVVHAELSLTLSGVLLREGRAT